MAIQQGNTVCVMGCPKSTSKGLVFNFHVQQKKCYDLSQKKILNSILIIFFSYFSGVKVSNCHEMKHRKIIPSQSSQNDSLGISSSLEKKHSTLSELVAANPPTCNLACSER